MVNTCATSENEAARLRSVFSKTTLNLTFIRDVVRWNAAKHFAKFVLSYAVLTHQIGMLWKLARICADWHCEERQG
jgi:hypothetical protein